MTGFSTPRALHAGAAAIIVLSAGVWLGTWASTPSSGEAQRRAGKPATDIAPSAKAASPAPDSVRPPIAANAAGGMPVQEVPPAPGYESLVAGPRPDFGGEYRVLRNAELSGDAPASEVPAQRLPSAPSVLVTAMGTPDSVAPGDSASRRLEEEPRRASPIPNEDRRFRPAPAQGIPRGIALRTPLLALVGAGGRVAFHDLGMRSGVEPAGLEGEWAEIGRCGTGMRLEFAMPSRASGDLRAVGRGTPGPRLAVPVVPRQACGVAGERFARPREPGSGEVVRYGLAASAEGFAAEDLREVLPVRGGLLLVFRNGARGSSSLLLGSAPGSGTLWAARTEPGEGELMVIGVYRGEPATEHVWIVAAANGVVQRLYTLSIDPSGGWKGAGPIPLQPR
jgi:hypothetical protein